MSELASLAVLERECRTFTRYLVGREPTPYVVGKYCEAHAVSAAYAAAGFDARLTRVARTHPAATYLADAHARAFAPRGALRKKLVLVLAILETCPPFYPLLERVVEGRLVLPLLAVGLRAALLVPVLLLGALLFFPLRLGGRGRGGGTR